MEHLIISIDDERVKYLKKRDSKLSLVIDYIGSVKYSYCNDYFKFLVGEIVGQMLSNKVSYIIEKRLISLCNDNVSPEKIIELSIDRLRSIGLSYAKSNYLHNLSNAVLKNEINLIELNSLSDNDIIKNLTKIKGIGKWTTKMFLIFALQRENVLPFEDGAFLQSYKWLYNTKDVRPKSIQQQCECWNPYSSIAARYLYMALDSGLTKKELTMP